MAYLFFRSFTSTVGVNQRRSQVPLAAPGATNAVSLRFISAA